LEEPGSDFTTRCSSDTAVTTGAKECDLLGSEGGRNLAGRCWHANQPQPQAPSHQTAPESTEGRHPDPAERLGMVPMTVIIKAAKVCSAVAPRQPPPPAA
jgi:hypothetical protein